MYVELKSRSKKYENYPSVMINYSKIQNFNNNFPNTLMIFQYEDNYKYILFNEKMLKYDCINQRNNQEVIFIPDTDLLKSNIEDLGKYIRKKLK